MSAGSPCCNSSSWEAAAGQALCSSTARATSWAAFATVATLSPLTNATHGSVPLGAGTFTMVASEEPATGMVGPCEPP